MQRVQQPSTIEVTRVLRVSGQDTTIRLDLSCNGQQYLATVRRSLNPGLFDFLSPHAARVERGMSTFASGSPGHLG
jgi:hypothetical protein